MDSSHNNELVNRGKNQNESKEKDTYPLIVKTQFIMSLIEQIDKGGVGPKHRSIIDRCMNDIYRNAYDTGETPTLTTLREELLKQPEKIARDIALSLELYTVGSLDIFGHESNVDLNKRVIVFDIHELGAQLKPAGLLVITDTMLNRVSYNWKRGKDNLNEEERRYIIDQVVEVSKIVAAKDTENKRFLRSNMI